jgi:hypothetical protein
MTPKSAYPAGVVVSILLVNEEVHLLGVDLREEIDEV